MQISEACRTFFSTYNIKWNSGLRWGNLTSWSPPIPRFSTFFSIRMDMISRSYFHRLRLIAFSCWPTHFSTPVDRALLIPVLFSLSAVKSSFILSTALHNYDNNNGDCLLVLCMLVLLWHTGFYCLWINSCQNTSKDSGILTNQLSRKHPTVLILSLCNRVLQAIAIYFKPYNHSHKLTH